jgi:Chemotaxis response regulator containing a CheY-like receiver domain and a methylesterase domain
MVVDDSAVVRGLISRMLSADPAIHVVSSVSNGLQAVAYAESDRNIDVVILDVEMPLMDGLTALKRLLAIDPANQVIMASTLTQRNAEISLQAMAAGATDYVPKPTTERLGSSEEFRRELLAKVKAIGGRRRRSRSRELTRPDLTAASLRPAPDRQEAVARSPIKLRAAGSGRPEVIAIGCSTGGPQALSTLLRQLRPDSVRQPILITQHMPPTFTTILAEHLSRLSGWNCREAVDGDLLVPRQILVAPGDRHMIVDASCSGSTKVRLTCEPRENFCRPSVDPMLRSIVSAYGSRALAVILTGMGSDGCEGGRRLVAAGGTLIAQDEATSVVWGMPGAVAAAGLCSAVLPIGELAPAIIKFAGGVLS